MKKLLWLLPFCVLAANPALARDQVRIVGSSTVYPFSATVAEQLARGGKDSSKVVVESTGTGAGFKLFCAGVGPDFPDIANASRRIKPAEFETCAKNGAGEMIEAKIGFDGIVMATSRRAPEFNVTRQQIYLALAKTVPQNGKFVPNPYQKWSDIDPKLPAEKIQVFGPPPSSGTRDSFVELAIKPSCEKMGGDEKSCGILREDGAFIEAGENDNLIVQKLIASPGSIGVFGYSFLDQNRDQLQALSVEGQLPTFEEIQSGQYPVARPLYFYIKSAHLDAIAGLRSYANAFMDEKSIGDSGYLAAKGLVPLPKKERETARAAVTSGKALSF